MRSIRARIWCCFGAAVGAIALASPCICAGAPAPPAKNAPTATVEEKVVAQGVTQGVAQVTVTLVPRKGATVYQATAHKYMEPGESILLTGVDITRANVNLSDVVDVIPVSKAAVILNAKTEGKATVRIWDKKWWPATYYVTVSRIKPDSALVAAELAQKAAELSRRIGVPTINVQAIGDSIVLTGTAKTDDQIKRAAYIAEGSGLKVLNLVKIESITAAAVIESVSAVINNPDVTYKELPDNTVFISGVVPTTTEVLRIRDIIGAWVGDVQTSSGGTNVKSETQVNFGSQQPITAPDAVDRAKAEVGLTDDGGIVVGEEVSATRCVFSGRVPNGPRVVAVLNADLSTGPQVLVTAQVLEIDRSKLKDLGITTNGKAGSFWWESFDSVSGVLAGLNIANGVKTFGKISFRAQLNALVEQKCARILSEPKLLIADGHVASILVGGELPIPMVQQTSGTGIPSVTVQYKPFGIQLTVRPKIGIDNRISLTVTPEVSNIDNTNGITQGGITIPAITVSRATTTVHVESGQPLAIGGLFSSNTTRTVSEIPLLSKIPILGELFKSRKFREQQTELVIIVTPQVIEKGAKSPIPVPSEK